MKRLNFFNKKREFITLKEVLDITGGSTLSNVDLNKKIHDIEILDLANQDQISFLNSGQYVEKFLNSNVGFCIIEEKHLAKTPSTIIPIIHPNPYFAYSKIVDTFYVDKKFTFSDKLIDDSASIGEGCIIAPNSYIGKNVKIGKNCFIGASTTIMDGCIIGDNCVINSSAVISFSIIGNNSVIFNGAKIGQDGFGFVNEKGINYKIIQIGIVEIGNNVEIGANTCIDRGAIGNTIIADNVKIDNLVQIGHNVKIDQGTVIAGCTAIAGSAKIGKFVQIGGNTSIAGHISIGDFSRIAGMSGIMRDILPKEIVAGAPSMPIKKWHRLNVLLNKMISSKEE